MVAGFALLLSACGVDLPGSGSAQGAAITLKPSAGASGTEASAAIGSVSSSTSDGSVIVVIGDSISTGYQTSVEDSWPNLLMLDFGRNGVPVTVVNAAENGAGYLVPGADGMTFDEQAESVVAADASVVLVYGSENDIGEDLPQISSKVETIANTVRERAPKAQLVFIGPASYEQNVDPELTAIRDQIALGAQTAGVDFVDPIAQQWIMADRENLIGPDGDHPSVQGHVYLSQKFEAMVAPLLGVAPPKP